MIIKFKDFLYVQKTNFCNNKFIKNLLLLWNFIITKWFNVTINIIYFIYFSNLSVLIIFIIFISHVEMPLNHKSAAFSEVRMRIAVCSHFSFQRSVDSRLYNTNESTPTDDVTSTLIRRCRPSYPLAVNRHSRSSSRSQSLPRPLSSSVSKRVHNACRRYAVLQILEQIPWFSVRSMPSVIRWPK